MHQKADGRSSAWKQRADFGENDVILGYEDLQGLHLLPFSCLLK
jgi:hypothetical protein